MINYWYKDPFVYRSSDGGHYEYFSYETGDWIHTYDVDYKELIHLPEPMAYRMINDFMEVAE